MMGRNVIRLDEMEATYSSNAAGLTGGIVAFMLASNASIFALTSYLRPGKKA